MEINRIPSWVIDWDTQILDWDIKFLCYVYAMKTKQFENDLCFCGCPGCQSVKFLSKMDKRGNVCHDLENKNFQQMKEL